MFEPDPDRTYFDIKQEQIITLLNSTIRPQVAVAGPTEPADAYVCTFRSGDLYETLVFFHLVNSNRGIVYHWDAGPQPRKNAKAVEKEALRFLEEMGFQMDSLHFRKKTPEEQEELIRTLPPFQPSLTPTEEEIESLEAVAIEEADEIADDVEEITVESVAEEAEPLSVEPEPAATAEEEVEAFEIPEASSEDIQVEVEHPAAEPEVDGFEEVPVEVEQVEGTQPAVGEAMQEEIPTDAGAREMPPMFEEAEPEEVSVTTEDVSAAPEEITEMPEAVEEVSTAQPIDEFDEALSAEVTPEAQAELPGGAEQAGVSEVVPEPPAAETPAASPLTDTAPQVSGGQPPAATPPSIGKPQQTEEKVKQGEIDLEPLARFLASM